MMREHHGPDASDAAPRELGSVEPSGMGLVAFAIALAFIAAVMIAVR